jgi:hypothetical protein
MLRKLTLIVLFGLTAAACGCRGLGYLGYLFSPPERKQTVPADYDKLPGHSVAVVVFADDAVQFDYPALRLEMTSVVAEELRDKVEDLTVVDPLRVVKYQEQNIYWDAMDKTTLGRKLGAEYVLLVSVIDFRGREPAGTNAFRGRAVAEAALYKTSLSERQARLRHYPDLRVVYPPEGMPEATSGQTGDVRYRTQQLLAEIVVRKFYEHKVPAGEGAQ